tara:strand:+ start:97 stop:366 length:270 start_codon:yes stop_codon:yes gene_type:complete
MTKSDFKTRVGMGFFSCKWINNKGEVSVIKRAILGQYAWRHTNLATRNSIREHDNYVLAYRVGNGLDANHRRWANINTNNILEINGARV